MVCLYLSQKQICNKYREKKKKPETILLFLPSEEGEPYFKSVGFLLLFSVHILLSFLKGIWCIQWMWES